METSSTGSSTACSSFVMEISSGPSTSPEATIRMAITIPAKIRPFFAPIRLTSHGAQNIPAASRNTWNEFR